jgi:predicted PurR-regulated permease PerM
VLSVCFGVGAVVALAWFLLHTGVALTLALGSATAAVALNHAVEGLVGRGLRRGWAIAAVVGAVTALLAGLGLLLFPPIVAQLTALWADAPALWTKLLHTRWFVRLDAQLHLVEELRASSPTASNAVYAIGSLVNLLAGVLAFLFLAVFMLIFGRDLVASLLVELTPRSRERWERMAGKIYRSVGGYLGGLLGICAINGILTTIFLAIVGMPFFLPLGILSGISSLVPYAGPLVVGAAISLLALLSGGAWMGLGVAVYFAIYGQLEGNVLAPWVYRRTAHVNQLVTLLAILFLAEFMGVAGAVLAVPVAAAAQVVIAEVLRFRRETAARPVPSGPPA